MHLVWGHVPALCPAPGSGLLRLPSVLSESLMLIVTPGQGKVTGTRCQKSQIFICFTRKKIPWKGSTFFPIKMKQNVLIDFLSVGNFPSEVDPTHRHS